MRCQWHFALSRAHDIVQYIEAYRSSLTVASKYITRTQKVKQLLLQYMEFSLCPECVGLAVSAAEKSM